VDEDTATGGGAGTRSTPGISTNTHTSIIIITTLLSNNVN